MGNLLQKKMYTIYEKMLLGVLDQFAEVKPKVIETMEFLRKHGIKIGSTTGYTDKMMAIVTKKAKENGYEPDTWFSPDAVHQKGRPYPYMIFKNMEVLEVTSVEHVIKVGDTISDIKEGKNAGVLSVAVLEGSSEMGLSQEEYEALSEEEKQDLCEKTKQNFLKAGADYVIRDMSDLLGIVSL
ncbi:phosphonoacetaldehyde hydrolase [Anaerostipes sp.]|uniref:phosphonoacetaldehyde hydrolase n=1 Tax=Anaerostipes sp. TaxID=1872530 RepID=UPI003FEE2553